MRPRTSSARHHRTPVRAERAPFADGTLVPTPGIPEHLIPSLLAASDVLGTGWFAAVAAEAGPGKTVAVVGDGAVGLLAILAAKELGAERIIAMSRHADRQALAREFGATDIVEERGDEGVARIKELTDGLGAHSVIEAVGTQESMMQAIRSTRPGGHVGYVGVSHASSCPATSSSSPRSTSTAVRPPCADSCPTSSTASGSVRSTPARSSTWGLPLDDAAEGYRAMDERRAIKVLLRP